MDCAKLIFDWNAPGAPELPPGRRYMLHAARAAG